MATDQSRQSNRNDCENKTSDAPATDQSPIDAALSPSSPLTILSQELLRHARELHILHAGETYRLRLTKQNKLILTK